jgi:glycosyltransferase involved in cell wall biosynthesis
MPEVSVVVPTKDRLPYLRNTIRMFLSHDEVKEIIIVVDGCQDGTLEYLKAASAADARIRYVANATNMGVAYSRNRGINLAKYDYAFVAEDDLTLSEKFFTILLAHMQDSGADIISARNIFRWQNESMPDAIARTDKLTGPTINKGLITVRVEMPVDGHKAQPLLPSPMLGKTEIFRKVGWDENLWRGSAWREESDFQLEAWKSGYRLVYCPHTISFNLVIDNDRGGVHASTGFRRVKSIVKNNWYFIHKHREVIAREFGVTNLYFYIARFAAWKIYQDMIKPPFWNAALRVLRPLRRKWSNVKSYILQRQVYS